MRQWATIGILFFAPFLAYAAVSDDVTVADSTGAVRETFVNDEDIYVGGDCVLAADDRVDVYIVANRSSWKDETVIEDVSESVESIEIAEDGDVPRQRVWRQKTSVGEYDIVLDARGNGRFDEDEDCVTSGSFNIIVSGDGVVSAGSKNPDEDFRWWIEKGPTEVVMVQMRLRATDEEDLRITSFEIDVSGTGNERNNLTAIAIAEDKNGDAIYQHGKDSIWGTGTYKGVSRTITVPVDVTMSAGSTRTVIVVYVMGEDLRTGDTFIATLKKITAEGLLSEASITFDNASLRSVMMDVYGSGDAPESVIFSAPAPTTVSDNPKPNTSSNTSAPTTDTPKLFGPVFSDEEDAEDLDEDTPAPTWLKGFVLFGTAIIAIFIIIKILKFIFWMILEVVDKIRGR